MFVIMIVFECAFVDMCVSNFDIVNFCLFIEFISVSLSRRLSCKLKSNDSI